jgi:hypothetical protein
MLYHCIKFCGSGTVINYRTVLVISTVPVPLRQKVTVSTVPVPQHCYTDLPVEEVLPDGPGGALGGRVPTQVLQLLVNPFQRHLYTPSSICKQVQYRYLFIYFGISVVHQY